MKPNNNINILIIPLILIFIQVTSCKKYLDKKSDSSLVIPTTLQDLQGVLDDKGVMNLSTPSFGEASADDYFLTENTYNAFPTEEQHKYTWIPQDYNFQNDWSMCYLPVYNSNVCIETIEKIKRSSITELQWNNVKGSALFYRAFNFLHLSWIFAKAYDEKTYNNDLGIVLRLGSDFNVPSVRSNVKEGYDRIIKDAKEAFQYLPDNPQHVMRPSKAAAYGLLARTYLSMRLYDSALKYADLCLGIKKTLIDYNDIDITAFAPFVQFNVETIFYAEMNTNIFLHFPSIGNIDTLLYSGYHNNDLRKKAFFEAFNNYQMFKGSYAGDPFVLFTGIATDEMYLIRAECYARSGNKDAALSDLNTLMAKRWDNTVPFPTFTAIDANDALNKVLMERRKELLMRGLRWPDIKRLNKEGENIMPKRVIGPQIFTLPPNDKRFALPLPADVIKSANLPQN